MLWLFNLELPSLKGVYVWLMSPLVTVFCFIASPGLSQSASTDPFLAWLDRIAQQQLDQRDREIAGIRTQAQAEQRTATVRAMLTEVIGGLPTYDGS